MPGNLPCSLILAALGAGKRDTELFVTAVVLLDTELFVTGVVLPGTGRGNRQQGLCTAGRTLIGCTEC